MIPADEAGPVRPDGQAFAHPTVIRLADGNDLDGVVAVGRAAWTTINASLYPPELLELFLAKWWTKDACVPSILAGHTIVAERDGRIVGMASYGTHREQLIVWKIYVLEEVQGQGIGSRLLEALYERAAAGHDAVYLSFTDGNDSAYRFATSHGYVVDRREQQHDMPDLVWMRHDLTSEDLA